MTDEKTTTYTVTFEATPEIERWAQMVVQTHDGYRPHLERYLPSRGNFPDRWRFVPTIARAILDAKPKPPEPDLLEQAYKIVYPTAGGGPWRIPTWAISAMSVWIAEHHNGRPHGYQLWAGKWYPWLQRATYSDPFDSQQETMAWLVVEMHREDTNA